VFFVQSLAAKEFSAKGLHYPELARAFYEKRRFKPVWTDPKLLNQLQQAIAGAELHGLQPANYHHAQIAKGSEALRTDAFLAYAHDLRFGRATPRLKGNEWKLSHKDADLIPVLQAALNSREIQNVLENLAPRFDGYNLLQKQLKLYRELTLKREWPAFDKPMDLATADPEQLELLRRLLEKTGDLTKEMKLFDAIARFQWRHGLNADGVVGEQTLAALKITPAKRLTQIKLNLERMRWLPHPLPERYVIVNVPGFELKIYDQQNWTRTMRVVVGKKDWLTPTFLSSGINQVILNPYWHVPPNIAKQDIYPRLQKEPDYLKRLGIQAISDPNGNVQLRQSPGDKNLLGRIKFSFPNHSSAYLHDSPEKGLFDSVLLSFSHGCIRVEDAIGLAEWILKKQGWTESRLQQAINSNKTQTLSVSHPIPLYIIYLTAWVEPDGKLQFRDDIYGKDDELAPVLYQRP
jgi:murein L,D-transpeptidase YcbB/YkuD